jgi:NADPH:quinone reductase-like Zn-dependent oxidoreductase
VIGNAVVLTRHGGPEALQVRPWEVPPPGPKEFVRVEAAGISFADLLICQGLVRVDERVASLAIVGGWAEYAVVRADWVVPVPATLASCRSLANSACAC